MNRAFVLGVAAILATVVVAYITLLEPPPPAPPPAPGENAGISPPAVESPRLTAVEGLVEIRRRQTPWSPLKVGDSIEEGASLRTGRDGRAAFSTEDGVAVELRPDSRVEFEEDGDVLRLVVSEGVAIADVTAESGTRVQFTTPGSDAVAEVSEGTLGVLADGAGGLQAAVTRGQASVSAGGETVEVKEGFQTRVEAGGVPSTPTALPRSLLLKVKWPSEATSKRRQWVSGFTSPGARVRVGPNIVRADEEGRFRAAIELREGLNTIDVFALDAAGRDRDSQSPEIELDTRAPSATVETDPSMWQ